MKNIVNLIIFTLLVTLSACTVKINTDKAEKVAPQKLLTVGVFTGDGAGSISITETLSALRIDKDINAIPVSAADIINGDLDSVDALIFPGGSGSKQLNNLGKQGQVIVKDFLKNKGKGIVGICAGAYMLCSTEGYPSLQIGDVKHIDRPHYDRGRGLIEFELNEDGLQIFPELKDNHQFIQYYDGPVMEALGNDASFTPLATYVTDIHPHKGYPSGITPGKIYIYNEKIGKGKIFAIGGHAESTPGMRWMIARMARWVAGKPLVSYDKKWIDPKRNTKAILFDKATGKTERKAWWQLFDKDAQKQIAALDTLYNLRSRPAVRWAIGLLRDDKTETRARAAKMIAQTEWTAALPDLKAALLVEQNENTKKIIQDAINFLEE